VLTKELTPSDPNFPLSDLRGLRAMLSPFGRSRPEAAVLTKELTPTDHHFPLRDLCGLCAMLPLQRCNEGGSAGWHWERTGVQLASSSSNSWLPGFMDSPLWRLFS
jgi:hypothetical protein